ncbi:MAG: lipase [Paenibacillus sp.]|nr:lipase [Paenibacillus sp.]
MKERSIRWLMIVSSVFGLVWIGGLGLTLGYYFSDAAEAPPAIAVTAKAEPPKQTEAEEASFRLLALGDSLTTGTGDPEGKGYVGYVSDQLKTKSKQPVVVDNYGINGQTSGQLAAQLQQSEMKSQVQAASVIVVSIGGNDLFRGGETLGNLDPKNIQDIRDEYLRQLDAIFKQLRNDNAEATIFLIGLYNPFIALKDSAATSKIVRDWNYEAAEVAGRYPQTVVVPTFDLFQLKVQDYLARDLFHPNAAGYRLIGDRVASLIAR